MSNGIYNENSYTGVSNFGFRDIYDVARGGNVDNLMNYLFDTIKASEKDTEGALLGDYDDFSSFKDSQLYGLMTGEGTLADVLERYKTVMPVSDEQNPAFKDIMSSSSDAYGGGAADIFEKFMHTGGLDELGSLGQHYSRQSESLSTGTSQAEQKLRDTYALGAKAARYGGIGVGRSLDSRARRVSHIDELAELSDTYRRAEDTLQDEFEGDYLSGVSGRI
tara:strand:+ start:809 stop:1471 length:663 start_codon:yes stop_codon:yes gene_type:complete